MIEAAQITALKTLYPKLSVASEGGVEYIRIEEMTLPAGATPRVVTALLCPTARDGYTSRLFLSEQISHSGKGTNWNPSTGTVLLGQKWWAVSWQTQAHPTLIAMVLDHLRAFQP
jgi:hypothetical protein